MDGVAAVDKCVVGGGLVAVAGKDLLRGADGKVIGVDDCGLGTDGEAVTLSADERE